MSAPFLSPPPPSFSPSLLSSLSQASASLETTHIFRKEPRSPQVGSPSVSQSVPGSSSQVGPRAATAMPVPYSLRPGIWAVPPRESGGNLQHAALILGYSLSCGSTSASLSTGKPEYEPGAEAPGCRVYSLFVKVGFVYGEPVFKSLEKGRGIDVDRVVGALPPESSSG